MTTRTGDVPVTGQRRAGARRATDVAYGYLAAFLVFGVLVQVYLAGIGIFGINSGKVADATSLDPHRAWGTVLMVLLLILLILALIAWASPRHGDLDRRAGPAGHRRSDRARRSGRQQLVDRRAARPGRMVILLLSLWLAITARRRRTAAGPAR
jgi:hypothetical protein